MDEDQEICRVCRSESTPDHPLYHPCKCSGSIRFVHEDCLIEWLSHSKKKYCELCEHAFTFSPIYRTDMPEKVPVKIMVNQIINKTIAFLKLCLRVLVVILVWLIILPNFTLWTWRFYFWSGENIGYSLKQQAEINQNATMTSESFMSSYLKNFLTDCLEGQIITALVIVIFVAAYLFREWVVQNLPAALGQQEEQQQQNELEQEVLQLHNLQQQNEEIFQRLQQIRNRAQNDLPTNHNQFESILPEPPRLDAYQSRSELQPDSLQPVRPETLIQNQPGSSRQEFEDDDDDDLPELIDNDRRIENDELIQRIFRNQLAENNPRVANPLPNRPEPAMDIDEPLDVGDDMNGVLEAIGMRGNPWILVQNSVLMSLMISLCLGVAVWIPYVVGRLVILIRPITFIEAPVSFMRLMTDPLVDFILDLCLPFIWSKVEPFFPKDLKVVFSSMTTQTPNEPKITNITASKVGTESLMMNMDWALIQSKLEAMGSVALARWYGFATGKTGIDRTMCILVGYLVLLAIGSWYFTYRHHRAQANRDSIPNIILQQGIFLKVLFFISIELTIFPTICGFLLDMSTLPLFENGTFESRYGFHQRNPYSSYFLHWFLGTCVLFYFATFIAVCREIIRPGVMWFIRDPNDPQFHPVQEMVERPIGNLLRKISQSATLYSVMLVFGVGSVTYSIGYTGVVFPLHLPFDVPLSTLGIDLLIVHFLLPPLVGYLKPREHSKRALDLWWHFACRQLRLTSFMFNVREPDEEGEHVAQTLKALFLRTKATSLDNDIEQDALFVPNGMMVRVPKYDSVPVDPKRRMIVPVDPITLEALDEEERIRGHPAASDTADESQATIVVYVPPYFKQRIILFLLYMWYAISAFVCSVTIVPLIIGRLAFKYYLAPEAKVNDLYSFSLGIYLMTGIVLLFCWVREWSMQEDSKAFIKEKGRKVAKLLYLGGTLGIVIPLLLGVAVDLFVFMPFKTITSDTGLVIHVSQNWVLGIGYINMVHNLIHVLPIDNSVRQNYSRMIGDNIMQSDLSIITRKVIVPVIISAILSICLPAIISWVILQLLDSNDALKVTRYTYPAIFGILMLFLGVFCIRKLFDIWMKSVRDDNYLIGQRLHNMQTTISENDTNG